MTSKRALIFLTGGCLMHLSVSALILAILFFDQVAHINNGVSVISGPLTLFLKVWNLPVSLYSYFLLSNPHHHFWTQFEWSDLSFIQIALTLLGAAITGGLLLAVFSQLLARFFRPIRKAEQDAAANP